MYIQVQVLMNALACTRGLVHNVILVPGYIKKCDELGWACIPLVVETYGCWGAEAVAALSKLAGRLSIRNNELKSKTIFSLYSRLGLTLVRANCRAILSRLT